MAFRKTPFVERKLREAREGIVQTARQRVESGGWRNCTLTAVAEDAGVATGSIYTHFTKVAELYIEVFRSIADEELAIIAKIAGSDAPPVERLERAIGVFSRRALNGRVRAYAVMAEPVAPEVQIVRRRFRQRFVDQYERIIADGTQDGSFRTQDAAVSASCVIGGISETLIRPLSAKAAFSRERSRRIQHEILAFCMNAVGAPAGASGVRSMNVRDRTIRRRKI